MVPLAAALGRVVARPSPRGRCAALRPRLGGWFRAARRRYAGASEAAPRRLRLNAEVLACGARPAIEVAPGTATAIATGGVIPRGADAVVMIEHTAPRKARTARVMLVHRAAAPGQAIALPAATSPAARRCCGPARR